MKHLYLAGAVLAASLAIAGCSNAGTANKAAPAAPANTAAPAAPANGNPAPGQARQNFTITNNTGHVLTTLNVSPSNEDSWGPDVLGRDVLANTESAEITFERGETQCQWDIRGTYDDGGSTDARGINLCEVATVNLTAAQ